MNRKLRLEDLEFLEDLGASQNEPEAMTGRSGVSGRSREGRGLKRSGAWRLAVCGVFDGLWRN